MNCPACSAPVEAAATWCPTCGAVLRVDPVPVTRPVDPARSAANKALAFSLPGLCCAPVAVRQRLAGKREAATIDERVACDLVEEQLREGLYGGWAADRVRDVVASSDRSKRVCPPIDVASLSSSKNDTRLRVRTVELERLEGPPRPGWEFLTSNEVGTAMDVRIPSRERAAAVRRISLDGGPYLVVFQTIDEDWPVFRDIETEEVAFVTSGSWSGWMVVVDTRGAQPVCETALSFEIPPPRRRGRSLKKRAAEAVKDLRDPVVGSDRAQVAGHEGRVSLPELQWPAPVRAQLQAGLV